MQFTEYLSTDGSAPTLNGTTGSLVTVLDAILVNGYGSKAAAGWSKVFSGTSKAVYRAPSGSRLYLRVQDDGPGAGTFREARITGYETMSDVDNGTGPFPTAAQGVGGIAMAVVRKSATADSTSRAWIVEADARTINFFALTGDVASTYLAWSFGEFYSLVASDAYNCLLVGRASENSAADVEYMDRLNPDVNTAALQHFVARGHTGTGGSVSVGAHGDVAKSQNASRLLGTVPYTNPSDGGLYLSPIWIHDTTTSPTKGLRGRKRGFWHFLHPIASVADGDTVSGTGDLSGKTFRFIKQSQGLGVYVIETSNTLETN
jgi:hypothetical protein